MQQPTEKKLENNQTLSFWRKASYFVPACLWAVLIFALSTNTPPHLPVFNLLSLDKLGHLVFYAVLTIWILFPIGVLRKGKSGLLTTDYLLSFSVASAYGILLEFVQARLPHRSFDYADMLANCIGASLACLFFGFTMAASVKTSK